MYGTILFPSGSVEIKRKLCIWKMRFISTVFEQPGSSIVSRRGRCASLGRGAYRLLGRRYSAVVKFLPFVAGVDFHPFGIPLPFYKRLPHFFKGLFGIGDDAFAFACRIIFNPIVYFLAPLIFSHDRDLSILVE